MYAGLLVHWRQSSGYDAVAARALYILTCPQLCHNRTLTPTVADFLEIFVAPENTSFQTDLDLTFANSKLTSGVQIPDPYLKTMNNLWGAGNNILTANQ
jgi:hypothetical protein